MIAWTEQAVRQLDQGRDYIALCNNEAVADRVIERVVTGVQQLAAFPMSGKPGRVGARALVIPDTPFIVAYTLHKDRVVVLAMYHGAQRWPEEF